MKKKKVKAKNTAPTIAVPSKVTIELTLTESEARNVQMFLASLTSPDTIGTVSYNMDYVKSGFDTIQYELFRRLTEMGHPEY